MIHAEAADEQGNVWCRARATSSSTPINARPCLGDGHRHGERIVPTEEIRTGGALLFALEVDAVVERRGERGRRRCPVSTGPTSRPCARISPRRRAMPMRRPSHWSEHDRDAQRRPSTSRSVVPRPLVPGGRRARRRRRDASGSPRRAARPRASRPDLLLIEAAAVDVARMTWRRRWCARGDRGARRSASIPRWRSSTRSSGAGSRCSSSARPRSTAGHDQHEPRAGRGRHMRRLPGGLAHADIACLIGRLVAYRAGNDRRFLPGRGGLRHGPPAGSTTIVTSAAVLDWDGGRFALASVHGAHPSRRRSRAAASRSTPRHRCRSPSRRRRRRSAAAGGIDPHGDAAARDPRWAGRGAARARGDA